MLRVIADTLSDRPTRRARASPPSLPHAGGEERLRRNANPHHPIKKTPDNAHQIRRHRPQSQSHLRAGVNLLLREGAEFVSSTRPRTSSPAPFAEKFPQAKRVADKRAILEDPAIQLVLVASILNERAGVSIEVMQHGKDVMSDKPGMTTLDQLGELKRVQAETGRIYSVCYSEHFETRSTVKAGELVAAGAIGQVVNTVGLGPHQIRNNSRPDWFYDRPSYGGILADIGSHQCEQFLFFSGTDTDAEVISASVHNRGNPDRPGLQDVGDMHLRSPNTTGYIRLDWFTPDGLGTWGDGRLTAPRHRGLYRGAQIYRHRRGAGDGPPVPRRQARHAAHRLLGRRPALWPAADRGRFEPHRDGHAAGARLQGDGTGADGAENG